MAAAILLQVKAGDHVVCTQHPYSWTNTLLNKFLPRFGVETTLVDGTDAENYRRAIRPNTTLLYLESPTFFTFELQDIAAVTAIAKEHNCTTVIDNSYASTLHQNPIKMGVDLVVHSCTKYIGGHFDVMGGVVCGSQASISRIFEQNYMTLGAILASRDARLLIRGLRTLSMRMARIAVSTRQVVDYLVQHPKLEKVLFPILSTHPQHQLAKKQMCNNSGQFSILLKTGSIEKVELFCNSLRHFLMAASWSGHESPIFPVAANYTGDGPKPYLPFNLIRFYIGLEDPEYLKQDLAQAGKDIDNLIWKFDEAPI